MRRFLELAKIAALILLALFVLLPSFYLFTFIIFKWNEIYVEIFAHPLLGDTYLRLIAKYLALSFKLALTAVAIDLALGIPLAYLIARREFPGKSLVEDLVMLPLVIPTSGFGFATLMTWTATEGLPAITGRRIGVDAVVPVVGVPALMLIVHVSLTFPYIVKTVSSALRDFQRSYEIISESLGAHPLTTFRKVTAPLLLPSILSGSVLALARSLGETGATMVVSGVSTTASIAIVRWEFENKIAPAAFLGALLVALALLIIVPAERYLKTKTLYARTPLLLKIEDKIVRLERKIPRKASYIRDLISLGFLAVIVVAPIAVLANLAYMYWSKDPYTGKVEGGIVYQLFGPSNYLASILDALKTSLIASTLATLISLYIAILTIVLIVKSPWGDVVRTLLKVPLVVPSSALGLSMVLLWGSAGLNLMKPGIWLIVLTHIVFSVPVIVETGLASYEEARVEMYEEVARTLGATPYDTLETISLPMIKRGLLAGSLLAFTHSLGETGATFLVMGDHVTISTLIVNLVEALVIPVAILASLIVIGTAIIILAAVRLVK